MPIEIHNPAAPDQIVATYDETPDNTLDLVVARARSAQIKWAALPQPERGVMVANFVNGLEARAEEIVRSITVEMGKPLAEARGEAMKALGEARASVARANAPIGEVFGGQTPGPVSV